MEDDCTFDFTTWKGSPQAKQIYKRTEDARLVDENRCVVSLEVHRELLNKGGAVRAGGYIE
jgi:hypothetical protein